MATATVDTNFNQELTACKVQPFAASFNDPANSTTHLGVKSFRDDLLTHAIMHWALMGDDGTIYKADNMLIDGEDYANWDGDNLFPFEFIGGKLGLIFI